MSLLAVRYPTQTDPGIWARLIAAADVLRLVAKILTSPEIMADSEGIDWQAIEQ